MRSIAVDGHVKKLGQLLKAKPIEERSPVERQGIAQASTFPGFCAEHDTQVFETIEQGDFSLSSATATVFAIRSLALELYRKQVMVELQLQTLQYGPVQEDQTKSQVTKWMLRGAREAEAANIKRIRTLFSDFHNEPRATHKYVLIEFDGAFPFACTGSFEPEWSVLGRPLFRCDPLKTKWNIVSLFAGNVQGRAIVVTSGHQQYKNHRIDGFLDDLALDPADAAAEIFTACAAYSENTFMSPNWFSTFGLKELETLSELSSSGVFDGIRDPSVFEKRLPMPMQTMLKRVSG